MELRTLGKKEVCEDTLLLDLPVAFAGTAKECESFAMSKGFTWKGQKTMLFGGYYVDKQGDCLIPT